MRTLPTLSTASLAALLLLAGCTTASQDIGSGGGGAAEPSASASPGFDVSTIEADQAVAGLVPDAVSSDGALTVGSNLEYAPAEFVAADGKTPVGFDIDIIKAVARTMGLEADVQSSSFDAIIPGIGARYEVGISSFTIDADRLKEVNMVSYFSAGSQFAVPKGNPAKVDPANLCGVTVGIQTGTVQQEELGQLSEACTQGGDEPIDVLPYDSQADVTTNLAGGKLDAMYADSPVVAYAVEQTGGQVEALGDIVHAAPYGIVVAKDDKELAEAVQAAVQKLMDDGVLREIADSWGNGQGVVDTAELNPTVG